MSETKAQREPTRHAMSVAEAMVLPLRVWVTHAGLSHRRATLAREALDAFVAALTEPSD